LLLQLAYFSWIYALHYNYCFTIRTHQRATGPVRAPTLLDNWTRGHQGTGGHGSRGLGREEQFRTEGPAGEEVDDPSEVVNIDTVEEDSSEVLNVDIDTVEEDLTRSKDAEDENLLVDNTEDDESSIGEERSSQDNSQIQERGYDDMPGFSSDSGDGDEAFETGGGNGDQDADPVSRRRKKRGRRVSRYGSVLNCTIQCTMYTRVCQVTTLFIK
jgi:hypothetical protein